MSMSEENFENADDFLERLNPRNWSRSDNYYFRGQVYNRKNPSIYSAKPSAWRDENLDHFVKFKKNSIHKS